MRSFYVKRKDLSHFPFQFCTDRNGVEQSLEPGYTFTFSMEPPKEHFPFLHIHILKDFARELEQRWGIPQANLIQVAAKAFEVWLKGEPIPEDHFNNLDMIKVDANWYPHEPDNAPMLAPNPYYFLVETDEPWFSVVDLKTESDANDSSHVETIDNAPTNLSKKMFVFGFTVDVCPRLLFIGYEQMRNRVAQAGLKIDVKLSNLNELSPDTHTLFVPVELKEMAQQIAPRCRIVVLQDLVNNPIYDEFIEQEILSTAQAM